MQKISYIIIFTLLLALSMVYIQLADYQQITSSLLKNNTNHKETIKKLENRISTLEQEHQEFQNTIITLEEKIQLQKIELSHNYNNQIFQDENNTINNLHAPKEYIPVENNTIDLNPKPNVTLDSENEITGFGLQYNQKF